MSNQRHVRSRKASYRLGGVVLAAVALGGCTAARPQVSTAGVLRGRLGDLAAVTHVIATGRRISPIGRLARTANFPSTVLVSKGSAYVLADGATHTQSVARYDAATLAAEGSVVGFRGPVKKTGPRGVLKIPHENFFQGLAAGRRGTLYAAGGSSDVLVAVRAGHKGFALARRYPLRYYPFPKDQYPYGYQGFHRGPRHFYPDGVTIGQGGGHAYVTGLLSNAVARVNLRSGTVHYANVGPYPFAPVLTDHGRRLVVTDWGGCGVTVLKSRSLRRIGTICIGPKTGPTNADPGIHPTALVAVPGGSKVVFTASNLDEAVEVDARTLHVVRIFDDAPYPGAPPGSYPDGLALHGGRLFVANAGNDDVAVFDLSNGQGLGLIPTGWYPTGISASAHALYVVAAKGMGSGPNLHFQWVGDMMHGLLQRISYGQIQRELPRLTRVALADNGFGAATRKALAEHNARLTRMLRRHIRYVVFILRENKTFDEELGKLKGVGHWADPHLALYGPRELPNLFSWAQREALFVNFYADGEVTAQGHQWTTGASDSDFVQRTWPQYYSHRGLVSNPGWTQSLVPGSAGMAGIGGVTGTTAVRDPYSDYINLSVLGKWSNPWIAYPERLYLFNDLQAHHVSFEDFGEFVSRTEAGNIPKPLRAHLARQFPGWDRMILDTHRAKVAVKWMRRHAAHLPRFMYMWLPDDHTAGRTPCYYTPDYYVANNDEATAQVIHYLSTTPQWKHMVVFVTEDDAQSGADHIDAHRTFAVALGPWVRHVDMARRYSQVNIIRTIEAVLHLSPMSQWDANAAVIGGIWRRKPDDAPVPVIVPKVPVAFNPGKCANERLMRRMASASGHVLTRAWLHSHQGLLAQQLPPASDWYTPTSLLKITGAEQMRQEWIGSKGATSYARAMRYLRRYARAHHAPVSHYLANDDDD
ncbi:MAG: bifunctional YncE family protein/alkaline phosphatase family protein [Steroidobacteraceae bacterium]